VARAYKGVPKKKRKQHGKLLHSISKHSGTRAMERLRLFQQGREQADYTPGVLESADYQGDIERYRAFARTSLQEIRTVFVEYERLIEIERK